MQIGEFIRRITVPHGYRQDSMTHGPTLPEGWAGDAWAAADQGRGYFLRAWNDITGAVAIAQSETSYEDAADHLRHKIKQSGDWTLAVKPTS